MRAESLLFDPESNKFCLLNETATFVWERLESPATVAQLATELCESFDGVEVTQAESEVEQILRQLDDLSFVAAD